MKGSNKMKWEYKTIKLALDGIFSKEISPEDFDRSLNVQGQDGWELVSVVGANVGFGETKEFVAILKRPVS